MIVDEGGSYNELLQSVQQQFLIHREKTGLKLQKMEEMMELVVQQFHLISMKREKQSQEQEFVNPFGQKSNTSQGKFDGDRTGRKEILHHLKLSFPKFTTNSGVKEWIEDCEQYFDIFSIPTHKRSVIAGMHLEGVAKNWYSVFTAERKQVDWKEFCTQFVARFGALEEDCLFDSFKQIRQTTTVDHYFGQFEKLRE